MKNKKLICLSILFFTTVFLSFCNPTTVHYFSSKDTNRNENPLFKEKQKLTKEIVPQESIFFNWLPLIATFVAGWLAMYQIRANNITNARIKWLENLKYIISDFFTESNSLIINVGIVNGINLKGQEQVANKDIQTYYIKTNEKMLDQLKIIDLKFNLIKLNLNPKEELHKKFEELLHLYIDLFNKIPATKNNKDDYSKLIIKLDKHSNRLVLIARYIMKLEWEKVKKPFPVYWYYIKWGNGKDILDEALNLAYIS